MIIICFFSMVAIILTEVMLSSKNRAKKSVWKKVLFWIVAMCISLSIYWVLRGILPYLYLDWLYTSLFSINLLPLMIPVRIVFELVLIVADRQENTGGGNNQIGEQAYGANYRTNTQNYN